MSLALFTSLHVDCGVCGGFMFRLSFVSYMSLCRCVIFICYYMFAYKRHNDTPNDTTKHKRKDTDKNNEKERHKPPNKEKPNPPTRTLIKGVWWIVFHYVVGMSFVLLISLTSCRNLFSLSLLFHISRYFYCVDVCVVVCFFNMYLFLSLCCVVLLYVCKPQQKFFGGVCVACVVV